LLRPAARARGTRVTTALLIRNPVARHALSDERLNQVIDVAVAAGWQIETVATDRSGRATELARAAAERGVDVVIVHGGDGTLNEALNGLAGTATAVAVLRGGTANVWAKETQCAKDPVASMRAITTGVRRCVDLGRAGDRYFLLMAGVGLDAAIVPRVSGRMKRWLGPAAYIIAGIGAAMRFKTRVVRMTIDGEPLETPLHWLLAGNTRSYGGVIKLTDLAVVDDGLLDVALMRRGGAWRLIADGARALFGRHRGSRNVLYRRARTIEIAHAGIPVQVDGEPCGETPLRIDVVPQALDVIVPRGLDSPLFARPLEE
jgi:YegS/Rv2252/BmrU family lipid kinase